VEKPRQALEPPRNRDASHPDGVDREAHGGCDSRFDDFADAQPGGNAAAVTAGR
jgi:hypothetical protein